MAIFRLPCMAFVHPLSLKFSVQKATSSRYPAPRKLRQPASKTTTYCVMTPYLNKLLSGQDLTAVEAQLATDYAVSGKADDAEVAALLCLQSMKGYSPSELSGMAASFRSQAIPVHVDGEALDIVGTGGDGAGTVNISTAAAIVAAAAGCTVAKHGSRSVSSKCGSADVLEALGVNVELSAGRVEQCVRRVGIGFMNVVHHHPVMMSLFPVLAAIKIRSVCNIIGPLLNPSGAQFLVLGVFEPSLVELMANVLASSGVKKALVVHTEGLDELSNTGVPEMIEVTGGKKRRISFDPLVDLGMPRAQVADLQGGNATENARVIRNVLTGTEQGPVTDAVLLNAGAGCYVYGLDPTIRDGVQRAREVLASGAPLQLLDKWASVSQE